MAYRRLTHAEKRAVERALRRAGRGTAGAASRLYERLRRLPPEKLLEALREEVRRYGDDASGELAAATDGAGTAGAAAAARTWSRRLDTRVKGLLGGPAGGIPGGGGGAVAGSSAGSPSGPGDSLVRARLRLSPLPGPRSAVVWPSGEVWLSRPLHRINPGPVFEQLSRAVEQAVRHGETATSLAQRMRDEIGHRVRIVDGGPGGIGVPPILRDLEEASRRSILASGDPRAFERFAGVRRELRRYADRLQGGAFGTRTAAVSALKDIEAAVARGSAAAVDDAIRWWIWNREQIHQRMIARTETTRAFNEEYRRASDALPWVVGFEWNTEPGACERCLELGAQDQFDLGPGGYPKDAYPAMPHPNCMCFPTEIIDESVEPTEEEWATIWAAAKVA